MTMYELLNSFIRVVPKTAKCFSVVLYLASNINIAMQQKY